MQFVRYNAFQKVMRLWDEVHPYNAAQIMKLEGEADYEKINTHWRKTLSTLGVGRIVMDGARYAHTAWNGEAGHQFINVAQPECGLEEYLSTEINRPFVGPEYCPFRPFVISDSGAHFVGVVYHHWPADSGSIKTLLREWFRSIYDPAKCRTTPLVIPEKGYWHYFGPGRGKWSLYEGVLSLMRHRVRFRRVRRTPISPGDDFTVKVSLHPQPDGMAEKLLAAARGMGCTVNDLFLAAMAEATHRHGANLPTRARDELALGTIVDLRMQAERNMDHLFGMFLGFTNTIVRRQDLEDWDRLLKRISTQTAFQKRTRASQASIVRMGGGLLEAHFLPARKWIDLYRKRMPMAAGISNINMNRHWTAEYCPSPIVEYIRIAPTSALLPLTFGTTTTGKKMNITMTRQVSLFDQAKADQVLGAFIDRLNLIIAWGETSAHRLI
jgi:hypothetical protein